MHQIEHNILTHFQKNPQKEFSTSDLIMQSCQAEYDIISKQIFSADLKISRQAKRKKAKLHRKFLYHINSLVSQKVLYVSSVRGKGEKIFSISLDSGSILVKKKNRQIIITKASPHSQGEGLFEKESLIHKFDPSSFGIKTSCVMYEPFANGLLNMYYEIRNAMPEISDSLGLLNFEKYIESSSIQSIKEMLSVADADSKDLSLSINLVVDVENCFDLGKFSSFIDLYCDLKPSNIFIIFLVSPISFRIKEDEMKYALKKFYSREIKFNLQNTNNRKSPIIIGSCGTYSVTPKNWQNYAHHNGVKRGVCVSSSNLAIDMEKCSSDGLTASQTRQVAKRCAEIFLKSTIERSKSSEKSLKQLCSSHTDESFFAYEKNTLRFWNYNAYDKSSANTLLLMKSIIDEVSNFCKVEHAIYNSCGIPIRFDISFSSAFSKLSKTLTKKSYSKTTIKKLSDFQSQEVMFFISQKEKLCKLFNGGDRARFFRKGNFEQEDIFRELLYLLSSTTLELCTYDFREKRGDTKLTSYL